MFEHIGITINHKADIEGFYKELLGLEQIKEFEVGRDLSQRLFGISEKVSVVVLSRQDLVLEVFLSDVTQAGGYSHIGISVPDRQELMERAEAKGFPVVCVQRESKKDLLFVMDHSGNRFEIK
jgi:catechol 2,3-dioxygenase-like lactoylglutathione lyase family enzyme